MQCSRWRWRTKAGLAGRRWTLSGTLLWAERNTTDRRQPSILRPPRAANARRNTETDTAREAPTFCPSFPTKPIWKKNGDKERVAKQTDAPRLAGPRGCTHRRTTLVHGVANGLIGKPARTIIKRFVIAA